MKSLVTKSRSARWVALVLAFSQLSAQFAFAAEASAPVTATAEDWKGEPDGSEVHLGAITGLGIFYNLAAFALLGTASKKIIKRGFVPDINNSVSIEAEAGPIFTQGTAAFQYSLHLRWDFEKDSRWTFFAIGGAGGYIMGNTLSGGGTSFLLHPRFGLGTFLHVNDLILLRGEVSHEVIAAGITIPFYL